MLLNFCLFFFYSSVFYYRGRVSAKNLERESESYFPPTPDWALFSAFGPWLDVFCLCIKRLQAQLFQNTWRP